MYSAVAKKADSNLRRNLPLDDEMQIMDIVDTLNRQSKFSTQELTAGEHDSAILRHLRDIYDSEGINVSDNILRKGLIALNQHRFIHNPRPHGLYVKLAKFYITHNRWIGSLRSAVVILCAVAAGWYFLIERPHQARIESAKLEIEKLLPDELNAVHDQIQALAKTNTARARAEKHFQEGNQALANQDRHSARQVVNDLYYLLSELRASYYLTIVSRQGEPSGVWRIPKINPDARNYYLIVEARGATGRVSEHAVTSEEDGKTYYVEKWGVRVSKQIFDRVRKDKQDDGIIQNNRLAFKRPGHLEPEYLMPVANGRIVKW